jgi:hypothetical protein
MIVEGECAQIQIKGLRSMRRVVGSIVVVFLMVRVHARVGVGSWWWWRVRVRVAGMTWPVSATSTGVSRGRMHGVRALGIVSFVEVVLGDVLLVVLARRERREDDLGVWSHRFV